MAFRGVTTDGGPWSQGRETNSKRNRRSCGAARRRKLICICMCQSSRVCGDRDAATFLAHPRFSRRINTNNTVISFRVNAVIGASFAKIFQPCSASPRAG